MKTTGHKKFKPFEKVLVIDASPYWTCDFYSHFDPDCETHATITHSDIDDNSILPYEGNEYLVGTFIDPEEEITLEEGEIVAFEEGSSPTFTHWGIAEFSHISKDLSGGERFYMFPDSHKAGCYFHSGKIIRFSDFNPKDMEETRKHILCVKNGKVVRYKEGEA